MYCIVCKEWPNVVIERRPLCHSCAQMIHGPNYLELDEAKPEPEVCEV